VLDILLQRRKDTKAAKQFFRKFQPSSSSENTFIPNKIASLLPNIAKKCISNWRTGEG
jgi:transposase-like protein